MCKILRNRKYRIDGEIVNYFMNNMKTIAFHKKASENEAMFESNSLYSSMIIGTNTETCLNGICDLPPVIKNNLLHSVTM